MKHAETRRSIVGRCAVLALAATLLSACVQPRDFTHASFEDAESESATVLLMPPDVEVYELAASGLREPRADWTEQARGHVRDGLRQVLGDHQTNMLSYAAADDPVQVVHDRHLQLVKLHERVGQSILLHKYRRPFALPTKDGIFDWTLGDGVARLREDYDADYALFIHFRDSFSTPGRMAVIVAAAVLGVSVQGGQQTGFASLVDLEDGQVAWFNVLARAHGDLRQAKPATEATRALLLNVPL